jgi:1,4-alpha-glucan branching enzyme
MQLAETKVKMLTKKYSKDMQTCRVTFELPAGSNARTAFLYAEFTEWEKAPKKMKKLENGGFSASVTLKANARYRFRYLLDGERWENDYSADGYIPNPFGSDDSLVTV